MPGVVESLPSATFYGGPMDGRVRACASPDGFAVGTTLVMPAVCPEHSPVYVIIASDPTTVLFKFVGRLSPKGVFHAVVTRLPAVSPTDEPKLDIRPVSIYEDQAGRRVIERESLSEDGTTLVKRYKVQQKVGLALPIPGLEQLPESMRPSTIIEVPLNGATTIEEAFKMIPDVLKEYMKVMQETFVQNRQAAALRMQQSRPAPKIVHPRDIVQS